MSSIVTAAKWVRIRKNNFSDAFTIHTTKQDGPVIFDLVCKRSVNDQI